MLLAPVVFLVSFGVVASGVLVMVLLTALVLAMVELALLRLGAVELAMLELIPKTEGGVMLLLLSDLEMVTVKLMLIVMVLGVLVKLKMRSINRTLLGS